MKLLFCPPITTCNNLLTTIYNLLWKCHGHNICGWFEPSTTPYSTFSSIGSLTRQLTGKLDTEDLWKTRLNLEQGGVAMWSTLCAYWGVSYSSSPLTHNIKRFDSLKTSNGEGNLCGWFEPWLSKSRSGS